MKRGVSPFPGRTLWTLDLNNQLIAPPAYKGLLGFFPIDGDRIAAYDLGPGRLLWIADAKPISAPVVGGDLLFVEQAEQLIALRTEDGSIAWMQPLAGPLAAPLAWGGDWLVAATKTALVGFRSTDGSVVWRRDITAGPRGAPALSGDRFFIPADDGHVRAHRLETGEMLWERRIGGAPTEILALDDRLYVGSNDNFLYCLFTKDGIVDWRWRTGADITSRPVYDDSRVYFVSFDNILRAHSRKTGAQIWKRSLTFRPVWPPVKAADTIVVAGIAGAPRAFYAKDGVPAGEMGITSTTELAAPIHVFDSPSALGPVVLAVTRTLAKGASLMAASRAIEPQTLPLVPLPGILPVAQSKTSF